MTLVLAAVIVATALVAVAAPFLRARPLPPLPLDPDGEPAPAGLMAELTRARDAKRSALEDLLALEADYKAGALAEADYLELNRQDEARALALIARVDALEAQVGAEALEAEAGARQSAPARESRAGRQSSLALGAVAALLLVAGIGGGYLLAGRSGGDPVAQAGGGQPAGMPGPVMEQVQALRARLAANPNDVEALVGLAQLNLQRQDVTQAIDYFKRALEVDAGHPEALTGLGMILAESGSFPEAMATFDRALARDPSHVQALWWKGQVQLYALKDYRSAVGTLERVVALLPPGPDQGRVAQALNEARTAAAATPPPKPGVTRSSPARPEPASRPSSPPAR